MYRILVVEDEDDIQKILENKKLLDNIQNMVIYTELKS